MRRKVINGRGVEQETNDVRFAAFSTFPKPIMNVTSDTIREIASLAKLHVEEGEISALTERFNSVLALFDELQSAPVSELVPMANPLDATQPLRKDVVTEQNQRAVMQEIAPSVSEGHYLVPRVVE